MGWWLPEGHGSSLGRRRAWRAGPIPLWQGRPGHQGQPQPVDKAVPRLGWDVGLQVSPAWEGPWPRRAVGSWRQGLLQPCCGQKGEHSGKPGRGSQACQCPQGHHTSSTILMFYPLIQADTVSDNLHYYYFWLLLEKIHC